jgi:hypothetical protein
MTKTTYKVASQEGVEFASRVSGVIAEIGETVSLDISKDQELAVIAAGWIEHVTTKPAKEDK